MNSRQQSFLIVLLVTMAMLACATPGTSTTLPEQEVTAAPISTITDRRPDSPTGSLAGGSDASEASAVKPTAAPEAVPTTTAETTAEKATEPATAAVENQTESSSIRSDGNFDPADTGWWIYTNGNYVRELARVEDDLYAATGGGVLRWHLPTGEYTKYTIYEGLPGNDVVAITYCPRPEPSVFVGTETGLGRFSLLDQSWESWTAAEYPMASESILAVHCATIDDQNLLLIGHDFEGLDIVNLDTNDWQHVDREDGLSTSIVEHIGLLSRSGDTELWAASGFDVSVRAGNKWRTFEEEQGNLPDGSLMDMVVTADGTSWIATFDALLKGDINGDWTIYGPGNVPGMPDALITAVDVAPDGTVWVGSAFGDLCQFDPSTESCLGTFSGNPGMIESLSTVHVDDQGQVFIGDDEGAGISYLQDGSWTTLQIENQIPSNEITAFAEDDEGYVWVGTDVGAWRLPPTDIEGYDWAFFDRDNSGLPSNIQETIFTDSSGRLWFGGYGGVGRYDGSQWFTLDEDDGLPDDHVQAIAEDMFGRLWFGTSEGLAVWNDQELITFTAADGLPENDISDLLSVRETMWVATDGGGLLRFDAASGDFDVFDSSNSSLDDTVTALAELPDGTLLVGSGRHLYEFNKGQAVQVPVVEGYYITSIAPDQVTGEIWVGTSSDHVFYFDGSSWQQLIDGPPSHQIREIYIDELGTVWFAGNSYTEGGGGLGRWIPEE